MNKQEFLERGLEIILPYLTEEEFKEVKKSLNKEFKNITKRFHEEDLESLQEHPALLVSGHFHWPENSLLYWNKIYYTISNRFKETKKQKQICYN